jgi:hypothetical protein
VRTGKVYSSGIALAYFVKHKAEFTHGKVGAAIDNKEHVALLRYLLNHHYISPEDVKVPVERKLVYKACIESAMTSDEVEASFGPWLSLRKEFNIHVSDWRVTRKAMYAKAVHKLRSVFNVS